MMNIFQAWYLSRFSRPIEDRPLLRQVARQKPRTIAEFGIQRGDRTQKMLRLALYHCKPEDFRYYCCDPFEGRTAVDGCGLSLRKAYRLLSVLNVRFRAVPAAPEQGIVQFLKHGCAADLMVLAMPTLDWVPRQTETLEKLLADQAVVLLGSRSQVEAPFTFEPMSKAEFLDRFKTVAHEEPIRRAA